MTNNLGFASLVSISSLTLTLAVASASGGCDAADRIYDCTSICETYQDCADADYDVSSCVDECRANAADSEAFEDKADDCQACVDDRSCLGAAFACSDECVGIVP